MDTNKTTGNISLSQKARAYGGETKDYCQARSPAQIRRLDDDYLLLLEAQLVYPFLPEEIIGEIYRRNLVSRLAELTRFEHKEISGLRRAA